MNQHRWADMPAVEAIALAERDLGAMRARYRNLRRLRTLFEPEEIASGSLEQLVGGHPVFAAENAAYTNRRDLIGKPPPLIIGQAAGHVIFSGAIAAGNRPGELACAWILTHLAALRESPASFAGTSPYVANPTDTQTCVVALPTGWRAYLAGLLIPRGAEASAPAEWRAWADIARTARN